MYRSKLEKKVAKYLKDCDYEPFKLPYTLEKTYTPDFVPKNKNVLVEVKGYFRTYSEASKYIAVRDSNPDWEIVFVFADPNKSMPGARKRKDGTKRSMGEWATEQGFRWYSVDKIKGIKI